MEETFKIQAKKLLNPPTDEDILRETKEQNKVSKKRNERQKSTEINN